MRMAPLIEAMAARCALGPRSGIRGYAHAPSLRLKWAVVRTIELEVDAILR